MSSEKDHRRLMFNCIKLPARSEIVAPLLRENELLRARIERLESVFRHLHFAGEAPNLDCCRKCGLDLRDPVHRRWPAERREEER